MAEKRLIEHSQRLTGQSSGPRIEGGVNTAPPYPRPNIRPVGQNKVPQAQNANNEKKK